MKGKKVFKKDEINKIAELIRQRCMANREEQKQIRAKMRRLGFYGFDDFGYHEDKSRIRGMEWQRSIRLDSWNIPRRKVIIRPSILSR